MVMAIMRLIFDIIIGRDYGPSKESKQSNENRSFLLKNKHKCKVLLS